MDHLSVIVKQLLNIDLTPQQIVAFDIYAAELAEWNEKFNLTAIKTPADVELKHFADSLSCLLVVEQPKSLIDIGTGAGFPGLPIKIMYPEMRLTLVESVGKKVTFLNHMVEKLALKNVQVINGRAEEVGRDNAHREKYDWAVARAVAEMRTLLEYLLPLVRVGGNVLAQKGESAPAEAQAAEKAAKFLSGRLAQVKPIELPGLPDRRYLVVFNKVAGTSNKYPRRTGLPSKEPLS
jgi:16S rRNA (guanine527-N7)-methyltransferase